MSRSNAEHRALLDAVTRGDSAEARRLGEDHVRASQQRLHRHQRRARHQI